ncbi:metallophosphoesterase [Cystobacter fuscus DSM 2262]|uniref:Metallophosphoesterase n=1 Tax=Cystobacter fuscus (strain ATCC 25194 / DSM 2262 / NBRC 100088 / M29) TaxID=1242864 RepID=S9NZL8_CYSF2|nr:metallophosphoesterase [Cystobacter fuscus]EPX56316.1 metallophosphoesterase [Cystobacter fuscus DSM 2262]
MTELKINAVILRFRDLVTPPGGTIRQHKQILDDQGFIWWGWWNKSGEAVPERVFAELKERALKDGLTVYLFDSGHERVYSATCKDIQWATARARMASPDPKRTPEYYNEQQYLAWFKLKDINETPLDEKVLRALSYVRVNEFFEAGTSHYAPFYDKRIFSLEELREQDRTIWFVRAATDQDPSHQVSLLHARSLQPAHFPMEYLHASGPSLLWLSDTHFSVDGHHRFPDKSNVQKQNLALALDQLLKNQQASLGGVLLSGDITWRAAPEEFEKALESLGTLTRKLNLSSYQIAICPGNHDLAFSENPAEKGGPVKEVGPASRKAFDDFYRALYYLSPNEHLSSGRRFLLKGSVPVEVVCLNSSLLQQQSGAFQGHGFVGEQQLQDAARAMGWVPGEETRAVRILMMHHHLMPTTYREEAWVGGRYSAVLDAEAVARWVTEHRVRLVLHGHQHQPFCTRIARPLNVEQPSGPWHEFYVLGLGSSGVELSHLGESKNNTVGLLTFHAREVTVRIQTVDPTHPSKELWSFKIPYTPPDR